MSLRGTRVGREHLMADECCFANSAPPEGPICGANSWPYGITVPLVLESKFDLASHVLARSLFVQFEWCTGQVPWASPTFQARIGHRGHSRFVLLKNARTVIFVQQIVIRKSGISTDRKKFFGYCAPE